MQASNPDPVLHDDWPRNAEAMQNAVDRSDRVDYSEKKASLRLVSRWRDQLGYLIYTFG
jgi:hypothetical protein